MCVSERDARENARLYMAVGVCESGEETGRRAELAQDAKIACAQLGFLRTPKTDLDAFGTFDRRLRDVVCRGAGVAPGREARSFACGIDAFSLLHKPTSHTIPQNRMPQCPSGGGAG